MRKRTGRTTRKYPRCKVCNTQVWATYASFCKKHSKLFIYLSRSARYRALGEKEIIELIKMNKYVINGRFKKANGSSPEKEGKVHPGSA